MCSIMHYRESIEHLSEQWQIVRRPFHRADIHISTFVNSITSIRSKAVATLASCGKSLDVAVWYPISWLVLWAEPNFGVAAWGSTKVRIRMRICEAARGSWQAVPFCRTEREWPTKRLASGKR